MGFILIFRGAQAAIVVYDITSPDTFKRAQAWVKELRQQANQNIVIALAGNKADLAQQRIVETEVRFFFHFTYCKSRVLPNYGVLLRKQKLMPKKTDSYSWKLRQKQLLMSMTYFYKSVRFRTYSFAPR